MKKQVAGRQCWNHYKLGAQSEVVVSNFANGLSTGRNPLSASSPRFTLCAERLTQSANATLNCQEGLFPDVAKGFDQLMISAEKLVGIYNGALAEDIERLGRLLVESGDRQDESPLTIDLLGYPDSSSPLNFSQIIGE